MTASTTRFSRFAGLLFSACLALLLIPAPAFAAYVTVSGIRYDIQFVTGPFAANEVLLKKTPWWETTTDNAQRYSLDYRDQVGTSTFRSSTGGFNFLAFATTDTVGSVLYQDNRILSESLTNATYFAYIAPDASSVPEINAGSLSQALLILLAFWLVMRRSTAVRVA